MESLGLLLRMFCNSLEIKNSRDDDEKDVDLIYTLGGNQKITIVNEYGLYSLVLSSRKPEAKQFRRWIIHEVIPSIRKNGMYATEELLDNPDLAIKVFQKLKVEREEKLKLQQKLKDQESSVLLANSIVASSTCILVRDMAKILKQNGIKNMGGNKFYEWLRENGYLIKTGSDKNHPTQKAMNLELFEVTEYPVKHNSGKITISVTTKITPKGQKYFVNKFLKIKGE